MSEPEEFDEFLKQAVEEQQRMDALHMVANDFMVFLAERGIIFDIDEFKRSSDLDADTLPSDEELVALVSGNKSRVYATATLKLIADELADKLPADFKKDLQAEEMVTGKPSPWFELIDTYFPGDSLTPEDDGYILNAAIRDELQRRAVGAEIDAAEQEIGDYLAAQGVSEVSLDEQLAIKYFSGLVAVQRTSPETASQADTIESVRTYALRHGFDMNLWGGVIRKLFTE